MLFAKWLRQGIREGQITQTVRIWIRPRVKVGNPYKMDDGAVAVDSIESITIDDVTIQLARACGFRSVIDMLGIAQHGSGHNLYLIRFHYVGPREPPAKKGSSTPAKRAKKPPRRGS